MPAKGTSITSSPDVAVVGGGIVGLAVADELRRRGRRVCVLERGEPGGAASRVAAGMLAPVGEAAFGEELLLAASLESARRFPAWAEELGVPLHAHGSLMVARDGDEAEALEREHAFRAELGLPVEKLRPSRARRLEPALSPRIRLALDVPGDHAVDPRALVAALVARVGVRRAEVARVASGEVVLADGERVRAEHVVVAAGPWSGTLGAELPVRPVKGQILRLRDPEGPGALERVIRAPRCYLVPRGDGGYVLGATQEERGWDTKVTAGGLHELLRHAVELVPALDEWELEEASAALRPGTPDNRPIIGFGAGGGLVWATGHGRHGVLLAPLTAQRVGALLDGEDPDLVPFDPARFARAPAPA